MPAFSMSRRQSLMYASALGAMTVFGATSVAAQDLASADQLAASIHQSGGDAGIGGLREELHLDAGSMAYTPPVSGAVRLPPAGYVEPGRLGDAASWMTPEFMQDYGLRQMNAQHAYARGLTGAGIRAGVLDDGVEFRHTEFAGKNNGSITAADVLANGSLCAPVNGVMNLTGCFYTQGDESAREFYVYDGNDIYTALLPAYVGVSGNRFMYRTGHGTHVAGTIAGNRDENGTHGVAYGASIVSARLFADSISDLDSLVYEAAGLNCPTGLCYTRTPQMSLQARTNVYRDFVASGVKVINNSWGYTLRTPTVANLDAAYTANRAFLDPIFRATAQQTSAAGILQVWSAGNTPNDVAGLTASLPRWMPEYEPYWVAVANIDINGTINAGSSICGAAAQWCVAAAGTNVWSAQFGTNAVFSNSGGTTLAGHEIVFDSLGQPIGFREIATGEITTNAFKTLTGTSMAAPHVTGALTLLFERYPYLQGTFIRDIMLTTARDIGAPGVDPIYGWGIVDLQKAINGPGQLIKDSTVNMTTRAGGTKVWSGDAWDDWSNSISGVGRLTKQGQGWLRLSGSNTFNGLSVQAGILELTGANALASSVDVTGGTLMIGGTLTNTPLNITGGSAIVTGTVTGGLTTVGAAGSLFGTGTLANTVVSGSITPGLSVTDMGRLNVVGSYVQNAGSTFNVATRPANSSGLLAVTGAATLNGGTVNVLALPGSYQLGQTYTILTATGGVTGRFTGLQTSGALLPFLSFSVNHRASAVDLIVSRGMSFATAASAASVNDRAVAAAIDSMPNNAIINGLSQLTMEQGLAALTEINGEAYAGLQGGLVDAGRGVRDVAISRVVAGADRPETGVSMWGDARRSQGERQTGGYARTEQTTDTYMVGADFGMSNNLTLGVFGGWGQTDLDTRAATDAKADSMHYGVYGAFRSGGWRLGAGVVQSDHDADIRRAITVPGLAQQLRGETEYSTRQYFADLGFARSAGDVTVEPYVQVVLLNTSNDGITETGGALGLTGEVVDGDLTIGTGGIRFASASTDLPFGLKYRGGLGYRITSGDVMPTARFGFSSGNDFVVGGAPMSDKAFVLDGAIGAQVARNVSLEVGYSGEYGSQYDNHIGNVRFVLSF